MADVSKLCMGCMRQKPASGPCPACGYNNEPETNPTFLPHGTTVGNGRYLLGKAIENNGEGITYIALDQENDITVTVREYFPLGLGERQADGSVKILPGNEFSFNEGCLLFLELSKKLLELKDLPVLYPVLDIFEEMGTAYRVCADVPGIKLREFLMRNGGTLGWEQAKPLFVPLITSLKALHDAGIIHRGISPDTLMVGRDGRIRLTGFCIEPARTVPSYLTAQLFPGFAAIEQYGSMGTQGDWTDIYGFGATLYRTLVGNPPPEATDRLNKDGLMIPSKIAQGIPTNVLKMMSGALQILPEERSQSMDEIREDLSQVEGKHPVAGRPTAPAGGKSKKSKKKNSNKKYALWAALATALLLVVLVVVLYFTVLKGAGGQDASSQEPSSMPSLPISSMESTVTSNEPTVKLYSLPNFKGQTYAQLISDVDYKGYYEFELVSKAYVGNYKAGQVYEQSPAAGDAVPKGTKVQLFVSLGPVEVSVPNVLGLTESEAKLKLYEAGFIPGSIDVQEKYDASASPGVVIEVDPGVSTKTEVEAGITIYINAYKGDVPNVGF